MADPVAAVPGDALDLPTPCELYSVGDLLDHIGGAALAFVNASTCSTSGLLPWPSLSAEPSGCPSRPPGQSWRRRFEPTESLGQTVIIA